MNGKRSSWVRLHFTHQTDRKCFIHRSSHYAFLLVFTQHRSQHAHMFPTCFQSVLNPGIIEVLTARYEGVQGVLVGASRSGLTTASCLHHDRRRHVSASSERRCEECDPLKEPSCGGALFARTCCGVGSANSMKVFLTIACL